MNPSIAGLPKSGGGDYHVRIFRSRCSNCSRPASEAIVNRFNDSSEDSSQAALTKYYGGEVTIGTKSTCLGPACGLFD